MVAIDTNRIINHIKNKVPNLQLVYIFGSQAAGLATPDSDIDFAIMGEKKMSTEDRWALQNSLALILSKDIDLVDLLQASTVMRFQIITKGHCIYGESFTKDIFELSSIGMYQHLQKERHSLIQTFVNEINHD